MKTKDAGEVEVRIGPIRDTPYRLERGTLVMPPGADLKKFMLSSGNLAQPQDQVVPLSLNGFADQFEEWAGS